MPGGLAEAGMRKLLGEPLVNRLVIDGVNFVFVSVVSLCVVGGRSPSMVLATAEITHSVSDSGQVPAVGRTWPIGIKYQCRQGPRGAGKHIPDL